MDTFELHRSIHISDLTWEEFNGFTEAMMRVETYLNGDFDEVRHSYNQFERSVRAADPAGGVTPRRSNQGIAPLREVERSVNQLASSMYAYVDRTKSSMSAKFGKESTQFKRFDQARRKAFDSSLGFRILYQLRNVSVHDSSRIMIPIMAWGKPPQLRLDRGAFSKTKTNAEVKKEVAALSEDPDLIRLCRDLYASLKGLNWTARSLLHRNLAESASLINWYQRRAMFHGGVPMLVVRRGDRGRWMLVTAEVLRFTQEFPGPPICERFVAKVTDLDFEELAS